MEEFVTDVNKMNSIILDLQKIALRPNAYQITDYID